MSFLGTAVQTNSDNLGAQVFTFLSNHQDAYLALRGRYFQGIRTHAVIPDISLATAPTLTSKPSYQSESLADFGVALPATIPCSIEIHQYRAADGPGWYVILMIMDGVNRYVRTLNGAGSETWRTHGWRLSNPIH